jgi:hypothetical protein
MIEEIKNVLTQQIFNLKKKYTGTIRFFNQPTINIGSRSSINLKDLDDQRLSFSPEFPYNFFDLEIHYFKENASKRIANCVEFIIENDSIVEIKEYWDEKIIEDFNANLPKSKRGKIKAWYDNEEEWEAYLKKQIEKRNNS